MTQRRTCAPGRSRRRGQRGWAAASTGPQPERALLARCRPIQVEAGLTRARVRPGRRGLPRVLGDLDVDLRLAHDAVPDALQPVIEPAVQGVDPRGAPEVERVLVTGAGQPHLARHAPL